MTDLPGDLSSCALALTTAELQAARTVIAPSVLRTPLLPASAAEDDRLWLKPELLQPLGSFKVRCAASAVAALPADAEAIATASAGNFAQGLVRLARRAGVGVRVHVPDSAPAVKVEAIRRLGGEVVVESFGRWWDRLERGDGGGLPFVHPFADLAVLRGDATIGLEILEDLPDVDIVVAPLGGGGLAAGIALALRAAGSSAKVVACEVSTAAPFAAALAAGRPTAVERRASFVDGIGSLRVLDAMWPLVREVVAGVERVAPEEAAAGLRELARATGLIVEGAAAVAYVAARRLSRADPAKRVVAVLSGRNLDPEVAVSILAGRDDAAA